MGTRLVRTRANWVSRVGAIGGALAAVALGLSAGPAARSAAAAATQPVVIGPVAASFYSSNSGSFDPSPLGGAPALTDTFPLIDFNPPVAQQQECSNSTGVDETSRPFMAVEPQPDGTCTAVAAGSMGTGSFLSFEATFTSVLTVQQKGTVTFDVFSDDGWILGLGPSTTDSAMQPTYQSGAFLNPPGPQQPDGSYLTPAKHYRVVGSFNTISAPTRQQVTVSFPAGGDYPIEADYTECCGGPLSFTLGTTFATPIPPAASWAALGPNFVLDPRPDTGYSVSGRVTAVAPIPGSNSVYVGTGGGGVWRLNTKSSPTWTPLSDKAPSLSIGALALATPPDGGSFLIAGTGEQAESRSYGIGIMRGVIANDGSVSWSVAASLPGTTIQQIAVDPSDQRHLVAASSDGLYASTDSGVTWVRRMPGNFTAVIPYPSIADTYLTAATTGKVAATSRRATHSVCSATIYQGSFVAAGPPVVTRSLRAMSAGPFLANVALTSSATQAVALASDCSGNFNASLYLPSGGSWHEFATSAFRGGAASGVFGGGGGYPVGQGTFDNVVATVPGTSCDVIVGGVDVYRITTSASRNGACSGAPSVTSLSSNHHSMHEDAHALAFMTGTLFIGNDGGLWSTPSLTKPLWTQWHGGLNSNQSISTFYTGEAADITHLIGGLQDNGTVSTLSSGSTGRWSSPAGGDGGYSYASGGSVKYLEQDISVLGASGNLGACALTPAYPFKCGNDNAQFPDPPLLVDTLEGSLDKVMEATDQVYLSTSGGGSGGSGWTNSSKNADPPLIASPSYVAGLGFGCGSDCPDYIASAAIDWKATGGPQIFVASAFGAVRRATSTFIGQDWGDIGTGLPQPSPSMKVPGLPWISGLAIDPCKWSSSNGCGDNREAWVTFQENGRGVVYHTNDYTQKPPNWVAVGTFNTPITSLAVVSTPNGDNNHVDLYVGTANEGVLTCGGCYGNAPHVKWSGLGTGLPNAWVSSVTCSTDGKALIAWTFGRGAWATSIPSNPTGCVSSQQSDSFR